MVCAMDYKIEKWCDTADKGIEIRILNYLGIIKLDHLNKTYGFPHVVSGDSSEFYRYKTNNGGFLEMILNTSNKYDVDSSGDAYNIIVGVKGKNKKEIKELFNNFEKSTGLIPKLADDNAKKLGVGLIKARDFAVGKDLADSLSIGMVNYLT